MKHRLVLTLLVILISFSAHSAPARRGNVVLMQPDGTSFIAQIKGDEFMKIITTLNGNAIAQDEEGWWCYAYYDIEGTKHCSGYRIGENAPSSIVGSSRDIPLRKLASMAGVMRKAITTEEVPILARINNQTKSDEVQNKHGIIILAQFKDVKFTYTREDFDKLLNQKGYSLNGATGCAKDYFDAQFNGQFEFSFDVSEIVTLPNNASYYGKNNGSGSDKLAYQMIIDACKLADNEVDFSLYDDDNDGVIDNVFVFFAGGDEAEGAGEDRIWSHAWYIYQGAMKNVTLDGKQLDRYACSAELTRMYQTHDSFTEIIAGIGTFCHEYFHTFGIPDLYDTDYEESGGWGAGVWGSTSLMDAGNSNNAGNTPPYLGAVERDYLGIAEPVILEDNGGYSLEPIHLNNQYYRFNGDYEGEYYLIEYRSNEGWDKYIGGKGVLIYHIDKSDREAGYSDIYASTLLALEKWNLYNAVNIGPEHQCADLVEADGRSDSFGDTEGYFQAIRNISGIFFPSGNINSLGPDTSPALSFWSGKEAEYSITNIKDTGSGATFNFIGKTVTELPPNVINTQAEAFTDAAIVQFESDRVFEGEAVVLWGKTGSETNTIRVKPYEPGKYSFTLEKLEAGNKTYTAKIYFEMDSLTGKEAQVSFMTKKAPSVKWPFIYVGAVSKNTDGSWPAGSKLPLRVYNAGEAAEIRWTLNGGKITVGGNGYYIVENSGSLKAHIIWNDGSEEVITKEITVGTKQ